MNTRRLFRTPRTRQRGVATLEFALITGFGLLPLLFLTYTGVMLMAVQQTLSVASAEGARASLRYASMGERQAAACFAARRSMQWLLAYTKQAPNCSDGGSGPIAVSVQSTCADMASAQCIHVQVSYDYRSHPFLPGTGRMYGWVMQRPMQSTAVAQLDMGSN